MEEKVARYFQKARNQVLVNRGIINKKYYSENEISKEKRQKLEYDDKEKKYFEIIPCEVTDEEFEKILKLPLIEKESKLAFILPALGYLIFLFGLIVGIYYSNQTISFLSTFNWGIAISIWFGTFLLGMIFISLGKIIELLNDIKFK